jgi:sialic acid synthase SpsE
MKTIKIDEYEIGKNCPPFIIAEAGVNHNGDINKAFKMIEVAKKSGATAIKFQTFKAEELVADPNLTYTYTSQGQQITEPMIEMFKKYEFSRENWFRIKQKCDTENIIFLSSPSTKSDLELLVDMGVKAIKVGSDDFTSIPLLKEYSITGLPLILSCGMSDLEEIRETVNVLNESKEYPLILLLCTSEYPTPAENVNLLKFNTLRNEFSIPLGFSDHTQGSLASSLAVSVGACVFEKHFTLDHELPGPDHWFSEDPTGLSNWVNDIKKSYMMMGNSIVEPTKAEQKMKKIARKSIVSLTNIKKNEIIDSKKIGIKRPGDGLPPKMLNEIIGKKATRDLIKNELLKTEDFV